MSSGCPFSRTDLSRRPSRRRRFNALSPSARSSVTALGRAGCRWEGGAGVFPRRMCRPGAVLLDERVGEDEELPHHGCQGYGPPNHEHPTFVELTSGSEAAQGRTWQPRRRCTWRDRGTRPSLRRSPRRTRSAGTGGPRRSSGRRTATMWTARWSSGCTLESLDRDAPDAETVSHRSSLRPDRAVSSRGQSTAVSAPPDTPSRPLAHRRGRIDGQAESSAAYVNFPRSIRSSLGEKERVMRVPAVKQMERLVDHRRSDARGAACRLAGFESRFLAGLRVRRS